MVVIEAVLTSKKRNALLVGTRYATYMGLYAAGLNFEIAEKGIHCSTCPPNVPYSRGGRGAAGGRRQVDEPFSLQEYFNLRPLCPSHRVLMTAVK
jgi:hypothetical protein